MFTEVCHSLYAAKGSGGFFLYGSQVLYHFVFSDLLKS